MFRLLPTLINFGALHWKSVLLLLAYILSDQIYGFHPVDHKMGEKNLRYSSGKIKERTGVTSFQTKSGLNKVRLEFSLAEADFLEKFALDRKVPLACGDDAIGRCALGLRLL